MPQGEGSKTGVPALAQDSDFRSARVLSGLDGPDQPGAERERSDRRGEHAPGHQHPKAVTAIFWLDSPLEGASHFEHDPAMGRISARADLRDRDVSNTNPCQALRGVPLDGLWSMPFGKHEGDHLDREQDPASPKEGCG